MPEQACCLSGFGEFRGTSKESSALLIVGRKDIFQIIILFDVLGNRQRLFLNSDLFKLI